MFWKIHPALSRAMAPGTFISDLLPVVLPRLLMPVPLIPLSGQRPATMWLVLPLPVLPRCHFLIMAAAVLARYMNGKVMLMFSLNGWAVRHGRVTIPQPGLITAIGPTARLA